MLYTVIGVEANMHSLFQNVQIRVTQPRFKLNSSRRKKKNTNIHFSLTISAKFVGTLKRP